MMPAGSRIARMTDGLLAPQSGYSLSHVAKNPEYATCPDHIRALISSYLIGSEGDGIYLTFGQPSMTLSQMISGTDHSDRILFLDTISAISRLEPAENSFAIASPNDLTGALLALSRSLKLHGFSVLFLDSAYDLVRHNDTRSASRFMHAVQGLCMEHSVKFVVLSGNSESVGDDQQSPYSEILLGAGDRSGNVQAGNSDSASYIAMGSSE